MSKCWFNQERVRLTGPAFGAEDFTTDIGGRRTPGSLEVARPS